jgi:hypothetical protein
MSTTVSVDYLALKIMKYVKDVQVKIQSILKEKFLKSKRREEC